MSADQFSGPSTGRCASTPTGPPLLNSDDVQKMYAEEKAKRPQAPKQFSELTNADKKKIIRVAAIKIDDQNKKVKDESKGSGSYTSILTRRLVAEYRKLYLLDDESNTRPIVASGLPPNESPLAACLQCKTETEFITQSVSAVEADVEIINKIKSHPSSELDSEDKEAEGPRKAELQAQLVVIGRYSKCLLAAFIALCLAVAFMFWPGLIQALPIGFDTAGQIAFGFCALSGVFLAIAAVIRPKSIGKNLSQIDIDSNLANPPKPPWYVDLAAIVLFAACMAALVLFSAAALNFSLPLQTDAINSAGPMVTYICGGVLGLSLCFPAFFALRSLCCPNSCACCDQGMSDNKGQEGTYARRADYVAGVGKLSSDAPANVAGSDARDGETCGCFPSWHN